MNQPPRSLATYLSTFGALLFFFLAASTARAQGHSFHLGVRLGAFDLIHSSDSYDAVYGDTMTQIGLGLELRFGRAWFLSLDIDRGEVDGEQIVFIPQPVPSGVETTLELLPVHLTFGRILHPDDPWSFYFGAGPTLVDWEESNEFGSNSSSDFGFHGLVGVRRNLQRWSLDLELLYSSVPDAFESGAAEFFGEDDIGGASLTLGLAFRL